MSQDRSQDWIPGTYDRFRDLRLRPALDLMARIEAVPAGPVIDLGCGSGAAAAALADRFAGHALIGVDNSPAMLAGAAATGAYGALVEADIAHWRPETRPALIFSNAALHWLADHAALLPRLAGTLAPGGVLAVQMPHQFDAPSHALLRRVAETLFPGRVTDPAAWATPVDTPESYARLLGGLGEVAVWETTYLQRLAPRPRRIRSAGSPNRRRCGRSWPRSTRMRRRGSSPPTSTRWPPPIRPRTTAAYCSRSAGCFWS